VLRVFAIQIQEHFRFEREWYRTGEVAGLVLQYYALLRSVLRTRPKLRRCLTRCWRCGIFFVAAACNAGRKLGCPFGCAEEHRQREWRRTSAEYYEDSDGKRRKSHHNQRQRDRRKADEALEKLPQPPRLPEAAEEIPVTAEIPAPLVNYVQRVVSGIDGRRVSREEILAMLAKEKSQHSLVRQRRVDQIIRTLHERPP
jgi:hypothetical protein